jgi:hypothetical protein
MAIGIMHKSEGRFSADLRAQAVGRFAYPFGPRFDGGMPWTNKPGRNNPDRSGLNRLACGRADADGAADLHLAPCPRRAARGRRGNAANGVPGEGRQFQLQSGQGRHTPARPAFADTHASSTARRNSLSSVTWLGESAAIGHSPLGLFLTGLSCSQQNFPQSIAGRLPIWRHDRHRARGRPVLMARRRRHVSRAPSGDIARQLEMKEAIN